MRRDVAELAGVTVVVDHRQILGPLDLTIHAGEHWALLGPNGAGKSTLLSLLAAERHPTSGTVTVLGARIGQTDMRDLRTRIGFVGQLVADRLPFHVSATEIVLTGRDSLLAPWWGSFAEADRLVAHELLARLGCAALADQQFGRCSQGERQRILLARSWYGGHRLLLLDEPAVGVDLPGREALISSLDELATDATMTTVHVVHTLEELPASTTHALLLRDGVVVAAGEVDEALSDETLSATYAISIRLTRLGGRFAATATGTWSTRTGGPYR
jgi:iron complex transport system ATP-binding protein